MSKPANRNAAARTAGSQFIARWPKLIEGLQASPQEMYVQLEASLAKREIPDLKVSRVDWREGGMFSAQREYLRIEWKRYICDYCAAPFGSGFFFSYWLVMAPPMLTAYHLLGMVTAALIAHWLGFLILSVILGKVLGASLMFFAYMPGLPILWFALKTGRIQAKQEMLEFLLGLTIVGPLAELLGRPLTYYEHDNISMFLAASHQAWVDVADEAMKAKGLAPLTEAEKKPVLQEFFFRKR